MGRKLSNEQRDFVIGTVVKHSPYSCGIILDLGMNLDLGEDIISLSSTTETPVTITNEHFLRQSGRPDQHSTLDESVDYCTKTVQTHRLRESLLCKATKGGIIGGIGVTARNIESIDEMLSGIKDRLEVETGKIVFVGNGLSDVPLILSERYGQGTINSPPVIVDIFDYGLLEQELSRVNSELDTQKLGYLIEGYLNNVRRLNEAQKNGRLLIVNYFFGSHAVPSELTDANLVVNCMGPPMTSISEQLFLLAPKGELYTTGFAEMIAMVLHLETSQTNFSLSYDSDVRHFAMRQTYKKGECGLDLSAVRIVQRV